jgi:hypothetical protein
VPPSNAAYKKENVWMILADMEWNEEGKNRRIHLNFWVNR